MLLLADSKKKCRHCEYSSGLLPEKNGDEALNLYALICLIWQKKTLIINCLHKRHYKCSSGFLPEKMGMTL
jgi:hypothetical protein